MINCILSIFLDILAARDAGLSWTPTKLPIRQVNLVAPVQPVHSPFLKWVPPSVALAPAPEDEVINLDSEEVEEVEVAQESAEDPPSESALVAAPFRLGPVPPLNRTIIPTGIDPVFPRGKFGNHLGRNWDSVCEQIVSIFPFLFFLN